MPLRQDGGTSGAHGHDCTCAACQTDSTFHALLQGRSRVAWDGDPGIQKPRLRLMKWRPADVQIAALGNTSEQRRQLSEGTPDCCPSIEGTPRGKSLPASPARPGRRRAGGASASEQRRVSHAATKDSAPDSISKIFLEQQQRLRKIFDDCDLDGSGDMCVTELGLALKRDADMAQEYGLQQLVSVEIHEVEKVFNDADKDKSGELTWNEFYQMMISLHLGIGKEQRLQSQEPRRVIINYGASLQVEDLSSKNANIFEWKIDYWKLEPKDEVLIVLQAIKAADCLSEVEVSVDCLSRFIQEIKLAYLNVPYHNFQHALATVHYAFKLLHCGPGFTKLSKADLFALIIGALCHDCGHRGRNTHFEVMTRSDLALTYNDKSPLENHHCAVAFKMALKSKGYGNKSCNIFENLSSEMFSTVRQRMVAGILATDMKFHQDHVNKLSKFSTAHAMEEDNEFLVEIMLHAADIGNPLMPPAISERWGSLIMQEFTAQHEEEKRLGLPLSAMMVGLDEPKKAAKSQVGFIDFIVMPLATPIFAFYPTLKAPKEHLDENREILKMKAG